MFYVSNQANLQRKHPCALEKAERYRLLNEPMLAESICLDILDADPENSKAIVTMLLAITDQFGTLLFGRYKPGKSNC